MPSLKKLPLTQHASPQSIAALWQGQPVTSAQFIGHVNHVAQQLPEKAFAVNLCEDRYLFLVSFYAVILRGQTNLLPACKLPRTVSDTLSGYPDAYVISSESGVAADFLISTESLSGSIDHEEDPPRISADHIAAIVFTSGSTGKPKANIKTWGSLYCSAQLAIKRFKFAAQAIEYIVATVPPQHMYGLETSIVIPMVAGLATVCASTFYPADIAATLNSVTGKCVLVSTPIHLKALADATLQWHNIGFVISATAMMPMELCKKVENVFKTTLYEIYGASEFGSIATRHTVKQREWLLYDDMVLTEREDNYYIGGPQLRNELPLHDMIKSTGPDTFILKGRSSDLIKIAGKRISLGELNQKLISIAGVIDGVFFVPRENGEVNQRLTAFVVAPGLAKDTILSELKKSIDSAFIPRPLHLVEELPRNATGKLPHNELVSLYEALSNR